MEHLATIINTLFRDYGYPDDVVNVINPSGEHPRLALWLGGDEERMQLLAQTLQTVFDVYFEISPPRPQPGPGQGTLF